jgi:hypothetical protein
LAGAQTSAMSLAIATKTLIIANFLLSTLHESRRQSG